MASSPSSSPDFAASASFLPPNSSNYSPQIAAVNVTSMVMTAAAATVAATAAAADPSDPTDAIANNNNNTPQIQRSTAELVEILIYSLCLCVGGPLNLISFRRLTLQLYRPKNSARSSFGGATAAAQQMLLLKLNLNIADLITMFVYTFSQIIWMITYQWHAGDLLCRVIKFFHTFSFYLNSFIVACFAIDRFLSTRNLNNPGAANAAQVRSKRMLAFAWTWATLLSIPQFFIFRVFEPSELSNFKQCTPIWTIIGYELDLKMGTLHESEMEARHKLLDQFGQVLTWERLYNMAHLLFLFWIPSLIIAASYSAILITLNSLSVVQQGIKQRKGTILDENGTTTTAIATSVVRMEEQRPLRGGSNSSVCSMKNGKDGGGQQQQSTLRNGVDMTPAVNATARGSIRDKLGPIAAQTIAKARQNAKRQAALILAAYLTFWSPYNLLAMINAWANKDGAIREISTITLPFLNSLIVVNPLVNPLIYGVFECRGNNRRGNE